MLAGLAVARGMRAPAVLVVTSIPATTGARTDHEPYIRQMTELTFWHDGDRPLGHREIAMLRRLDRDGAIRFVDATCQDATCPIDRADLLARFHARERDYRGFLRVRPRLPRLVRGGAR